MQKPMSFSTGKIMMCIGNVVSSKFLVGIIYLSLGIQFVQYEFKDTNKSFLVRCFACCHSGEMVFFNGGSSTAAGYAVLLLYRCVPHLQRQGPPMDLICRSLNPWIKDLWICSPCTPQTDNSALSWPPYLAPKGDLFSSNFCSHFF